MIPEGQGNLPDLNAFRIRPTAHEQDPYTVSASTSRRVTFEGLPAPAADAEVDRRGEHSALPTKKGQSGGVTRAKVIIEHLMQVCAACASTEVLTLAAPSYILRFPNFKFSWSLIRTLCYSANMKTALQENATDTMP